MKGLRKGCIALMTLGTVFCGMLSGCGSGGNSSGDVSLSENGSYPIVEGDEKLKLTMFMPTAAHIEDYATNDFTKYLEELTGIEIEFITASGEEATDTLNLMLQTDDYPDMIFQTPNLDVARYGVEEGIFLQLDDYINEDLMPNYTGFIEENGYDLNVTRESDGHIYALAAFNDCFHCRYARKLWVNTYYLDQMGCEVPTTTEEFLEVCRKFLEFNPDGVAVAGATDGWFSNAQDFLMGAYTLIPETSATFDVKDYVVMDGETEQFECVALTDEYREGLKFLHELYEMGAIYEGTFTQTAEQLKSLVNQEDEPVLFFASGSISNAIDSASNNELYRHYEAIAPLKGPDGTQIAWTRPNYGVIQGAFCVTDRCENVEAALRWADYFYTLEGHLSSNYGPDAGEDWILDPEGKLGMNGEPALYEIINTYSAEAQNHDWQDLTLNSMSDPVRLGQAMDTDVDPYSPEGLEKLLYDVSKELYESYSQNTGLIDPSELKVTAEEKNSVSTVAVEAEKVLGESQVAFITGVKDIDSDADWEAYLADVEAVGISQLLEVYQTAYDRTNS